MNNIISKFLLTGDEFMPEMHLKYAGFTAFIMLVDHLLNVMKDFQNLEKQAI